MKVTHSGLWNLEGTHMHAPLIPHFPLPQIAYITIIRDSFMAWSSYNVHAANAASGCSWALVDWKPGHNNSDNINWSRNILLNEKQYLGLGVGFTLQNNNYAYSKANSHAFTYHQCLVTITNAAVSCPFFVPFQQSLINSWSTCFIMFKFSNTLSRVKTR